MLQELIEKITEVLDGVFKILAASPDELPKGEEFSRFSLGLDVIDVFVCDIFDDNGCVKALNKLDTQSLVS